MITSEKVIQQRLEDDYFRLANEGYEVLGVFLQGSQNYDLDYAGSDIDTKAIVLPHFQDFVLNKKPVSTTIVLPSNEHLDVKDIRLMHECFYKQNINFLEALFTKYKYLNPKYAEAYMPMFANAEAIAHYNNFAGINCIYGMITEKRAALTHPYPTIKDKIDAFGYDPKQLHHILRCEEFLERFIAGETYANCLHSLHPGYLISVKSCNPTPLYTLETALTIADTAVAHGKEMKEKYMATVPLEINKTADETIKTALLETMKIAMRSELALA